MGNYRFVDASVEVSPALSRGEMVAVMADSAG